MDSDRPPTNGACELGVGHRRTHVAAAEVRTRRLVVTDADDRERIVAEVVGAHAELRVTTGDTTTRPGAFLLVHAGDDPDLSPGVGVQLWSEGQAVAEVNAWHTGGRWQWSINDDLLPAVTPPHQQGQHPAAIMCPMQVGRRLRP